MLSYSYPVISSCCHIVTLCYTSPVIAAPLSYFFSLPLAHPITHPPTNSHSHLNSNTPNHPPPLPPSPARTDVTYYHNTTSPANGYFIAVTNLGDIYVSNDQGVTWATHYNTPCSFGGVAIGSNGQAFVVGGSSQYFKYIYTASAGAAFASSNWTEVSPQNPYVYSNVTGQFNAVTTHDGVHIIAVGNAGLVYYSANKGVSWAPTSSSLWDIGDLYCVSAGSPLVAFAGVGSAGLNPTTGTTNGNGNGYILKTLDGGGTWQSVSSGLGALLPANEVFRYHAISALSPSLLYVCSATGVLLKSVNGGLSFTVEATLLSPAGGIRQSHSLSMYDNHQYSSRGVKGVAGDDGGYVYFKTAAPTQLPTKKPLSPTDTRYPTFAPTPTPSATPTTATPSTARPSTARPSYPPTLRPSAPSGQPTRQPSRQPTSQPTRQPTRQPSQQPTRQPSAQPTVRPSAFSLYNFKLVGVPFSASPSWVQVPQLSVTPTSTTTTAPSRTTLSTCLPPKPLPPLSHPLPPLSLTSPTPTWRDL